MTPNGKRSGAVGLEASGPSVHERPEVLKVAAIFEDEQNRDWVSELCGRVIRAVGAGALGITIWSVAELNEDLAFQAAVASAAAADVIMVSLPAAARLPRRIYAWVDAWRLRRQREDGTLIALIGVGATPGAPSEHVQEYFRTTAWEARLEFLLRELAPGTPGSPEAAGKVTTGDAGASASR